MERTTPSARLRSGVTKTSSVGMFATNGLPPIGAAAAPPVGLGQETDDEVGAVAVEADGVELQLVERARAGLEPTHVGAPGRARIVLVEADRSRDRRPEPFDVRLPEHGLGPALRGVRGDRPAHAAH